MHGPIAAVMRSRLAPSRSIADTTDSVTPASAPPHPACAAPITCACESASRIGAQSAERQDRVFGRGRAQLFRAGKLELEDMVDAAGNEISLRRLQEMGVA